MRPWQQSLQALAGRCLDEANKDHRLALVLASMSISKEEEIPTALAWVNHKVKDCEYIYSQQWTWLDEPGTDWSPDRHSEGALHPIGASEAIQIFRKIATRARRMIPFEFYGRPSLFPFRGEVSCQQNDLQQFVELLYVSPINMAMTCVGGSKRWAYTRPTDDLFQLCFDAFQSLCDQDVDQSVEVYRRNFATLRSTLENPVLRQELYGSPERNHIQKPPSEPEAVAFHLPQIPSAINQVDSRFVHLPNPSPAGSTTIEALTDVQNDSLALPDTAWNPTSDPIHFLIELHDVLRGGCDRFRNTRPGENGFDEEREALDQLRTQVHRQIIRGPLRNAVVDRAVDRFTRHYQASRLPLARYELWNLISKRMMKSLVGLSSFSQIHHREWYSQFINKPLTDSEREQRDKWMADSNKQDWCFGQALKARAEILKRLATLGKRPNTLPERGVNGPGVSPFCSLPPVVPTYGSTSSENARDKDATATSAHNQQTRQMLSPADREKVVSEEIEKRLGKGSETERFQNSKLITVAKLSDCTGVPKPSVYRTKAWIEFSEKFGKTKKERGTTKISTERPLTGKMTKSIENKRYPDPAVEAAYLVDLETEYLNQLTDKERQKHNAKSRQDQQEAIMDWGAARYTEGYRGDEDAIS